jgi:hypothetical protein
MGRWRCANYDRVVTEVESGIAMRPATSGDSDFLWSMIRLAAVWDNPGRYTVEELKARPKVASYLDRWEERGIFGLVVVDGERSVGAAWCSFAESAEEIFGFSAREVPVMVMALEPGISRGTHRARRCGRDGCRLVVAGAPLLRKQAAGLGQRV